MLSRVVLNLREPKFPDFRLTDFSNPIALKSDIINFQNGENVTGEIGSRYAKSALSLEEVFVYLRTINVYVLMIRV